MSTSLYISDEDINGKGVTEDGTTPPDSRSNGPGWHPRTAGDTPYLDIILSNPALIQEIVIQVI